MIDIPETPEEFTDIALIHKNELKNGGFVSECSINFIKFFYKQISEYNTSILLIHKNEEFKVSGFILCSIFHNHLYKKFLKENIFAIFRFSSFFFALIRTVFRKIFSSHFQEYKTELVNIAVSPGSRGKGIGMQLIKAAEKKMQDNNVSAYFLQVFEDNKSAVNLYNNIGFKKVDELKIRGRNKLLMRKKI